jgi:hypothetical protein
VGSSCCLILFAGPEMLNTVAERGGTPQSTTFRNLTLLGAWLAGQLGIEFALAGWDSWGAGLAQPTLFFGCVG